MPDLGQAIAEMLRAQLQANGLTSLGQVNGKILSEWINERFSGWQPPREKVPRKARQQFAIPLPEQVTAYSIEIGWPLDGEAFCLAYEKKDWCTSGTTKMRNWQAAVRYWKREQIRTKFTPTTRTVISTEPPGWASHMVANFPDWTGHMDGRIKKPWASLSAGDQKMILELIQRSRQTANI